MQSASNVSEHGVASGQFIPSPHGAGVVNGVSLHPQGTLCPQSFAILFCFNIYTPEGLVGSATTLVIVGGKHVSSNVVNGTKSQGSPFISNLIK